MVEPLRTGYARQWTRCKGCGNVAYYDYVPYSLSNPIMFLRCCSYGIGEHFNKRVERITADEALVEMSKAKA